MRKSKQRISLIVKNYLEEHNLKTLGWGDLDQLHDIYKLARFKECKRQIPQFQAILNALDRESKYPNAIMEKCYFRGMDCQARDRLCRYFKVKNVDVEESK